MDYFLSLFGDAEDIALCRMEFHQPVLFPLFQALEVFLESSAVVYGADGEVGYCVVGK